MTYSEAEAAIRALIIEQWAVSGLADRLPLVFENSNADYGEYYVLIEIEGVWAEKTIFGSVGKRLSTQGGLVFVHAFVPTGAGKGLALQAVETVCAGIELQIVQSVIRFDGASPPSPVEDRVRDREISWQQPGGNYYRCSGSVPFLVYGSI
jgi:hypothetical protein